MPQSSKNKNSPRGMGLVRWRGAAWLALGATTLGFGLAMFHGPLWQGGIHGDLGDGRFVGLILEHGWRWLVGEAASLWTVRWNMHPQPYSFALGESLLGSLPLYGGWRAAGLAPEQAHQTWFVTCSALNFVAAAWMLRVLGGSPLPVLAGAFLFAFGMPRGAQLHHAQLLPHFATPLAVGCLALWLRAVLDHERPVGRAQLLLAAGVAAIAWQVWLSVYLGWFLGVSLLLAVVVVGVSPARQHLVAIMRRHGVAVLAAGVGLVLCLVPLALPYLALADAVGGAHGWLEIMGYAPRPGCLVLAHGGSWVYPTEWLQRLAWFGGCQRALNEMHLFVGVAPWVSASLAVWALRRGFSDGSSTPLRWAAWLALWVGALWLVAATYLGFGILGWRVFYSLLPGGDVIRAPGRVVLVLLLLFGVVHVWLGKVCHQHWGRRGFWLYALLSVMMVVENLHSNSWSYAIAQHRARVTPVAEQVREHACTVFYYQGNRDDPGYAIHLDAMWASLMADTPTANGYGSKLPEKWRPLKRPQMVTESALAAWLNTGDACLFARP